MSNRREALREATQLLRQYGLHPFDPSDFTSDSSAGKGVCSQGGCKCEPFFMSTSQTGRGVRAYCWSCAIDRLENAQRQNSPLEPKNDDIDRLYELEHAYESGIPA